MGGRAGVDGGGEGVVAGRWQHGTYRVILESGAEFTFTGSLRFTRDADGYLSEWETKDGDIVLEPDLQNVAAILRVGATGARAQAGATQEGAAG